MKLSARTTAGLKMPAGKSDHIVFDSAVPGFGLRMREGGGRSWIFQYSLGTKQRRLVIGKASAMTADKAREIAEVLHAKVKLGGDPAGEKAMTIASAAQSFKAIADHFLAHQRNSFGREVTSKWRGIFVCMQSNCTDCPSRPLIIKLSRLA